MKTGYDGIHTVHFYSVCSNSGGVTKKAILSLAGYAAKKGIVYVKEDCDAITVFSQAGFNELLIQIPVLEKTYGAHGLKGCNTSSSMEPYFKFYRRAAYDCAKKQVPRLGIDTANVVFNQEGMIIHFTENNPLPVYKFLRWLKKNDCMLRKAAGVVGTWINCAQPSSM